MTDISILKMVRENGAEWSSEVRQIKLGGFDRSKLLHLYTAMTGASRLAGGRTGEARHKGCPFGVSVSRQSAARSPDPAQTPSATPAPPLHPARRSPDM